MTPIEPEDSIKLLVVEVIVQAFADYRYLKREGYIVGKIVHINGRRRRIGRELGKKDAAYLIDFFYGTGLSLFLHLCGTPVMREAIIYRLERDGDAQMARLFRNKPVISSVRDADDYLDDDTVMALACA